MPAVDENHRAGKNRAETRPGLRARIRSLPGGFIGWRIGVTIVGVAVVIGGIILLPLPGPGWLIIFGGLGILATEYEWARRLLRFARDTVRAWTSWLGRQPMWLRAGVALLTVAIVAVIIWGAWKLFR